MPDIPELPAIADQPLSVMLLAQNDAKHLEQVVAAWVSSLNALDREYELLLVDDGSDDRTNQLLITLRDRHRHVRVLRHEKPRGLGAALRTALNTARYPLFFFTRCDPRYRPADLRRLLTTIDRVHLGTGYRGGRPIPPIWRWLGAARRLLGRVALGHAELPLPGWLGWERHLGQVLVRLLFGVRNRDVTCPFLLARRSIFARMPLQSDGVFALVEILAKANFLGCLLGEEVSLGDRSHPVIAESRGTERLGQVIRDALRVFRHPDFGPVKAAAFPARPTIR